MPKENPINPPDRADGFADELSAIDPVDDLDWSKVTGEVVAVGSPPERHDLLPAVAIQRLAILFGKRADEPIDANLALYNHAVSSLATANISKGALRGEMLVEAARACLILAAEVYS